MKILLVNTNPVVSRLTALSARKEGIELDEIKDISEVDSVNDYNIVFIDSDINNRDIINFLKNSNIKRRVIFATQDEKNIDNIFNFTILKPFLPSEVSSILREAKIEMDSEDNLDLDDKSFKRVEDKSDKEEEEYINLSNLISTKDKCKEESLDKKSLETQKNDLNSNLDTKISIFDVDNEKRGLNSILEEDKPEPEAKIENDLFSIDKDDIDFSSIDKMDTIEDKIKNNKIDEPKTKSLNRDDMKSIKSILESDNTLNSKELELSADSKISNSKTKKPEESKKIEAIEAKVKADEKIDNIEDDVIKIETEVKNNKIDIKKRAFQDTVTSLPIEELRQLLRGTKVHITIEFPKEL
jgi:hypothetical protein